MASVDCQTIYWPSSKYISLFSYQIIVAVLLDKFFYLYHFTQGSKVSQDVELRKGFYAKTGGKLCTELEVFSNGYKKTKPKQKKKEPKQSNKEKKPTEQKPYHPLPEKKQIHTRKPVLKIDLQSAELY